jgi:hypothetical protein
MTPEERDFFLPPPPAEFNSAPGAEQARGGAESKRGRNI